jgi:hypothetical protein
MIEYQLHTSLSGNNRATAPVQVTQKIVFICIIEVLWSTHRFERLSNTSSNPHTYAKERS